MKQGNNGFRGGCEQEGNNGGSAGKAVKLDQAASSVAGGSCNSALEDYSWRAGQGFDERKKIVQLCCDCFSGFATWHLFWQHG